MTDKARLHRSELAVPGTNVRAMEKAPTLGADLVFLDLEDAVAPDDKEQARANVIEALGGQRLVHDGGERAHQRARHPLVLPRRRRCRRGPRQRARHRARAEGGVGLRRRVRRDPVGSDRAAQRVGARPDRHPHPDRDREGHGQRRDDRACASGPTRGDGLRRRRLRGQRAGADDEHRRRQPGLRGAHRCRRRRCPRLPLGRSVALRDLADGRRLPRGGPAPDRRPVRGLQRCAGVSERGATRRRAGLRRQMGDPPLPGRAGQRGLHARRRRGRSGPNGSSRRWRTARRKERGRSRSTAASSMPRRSAWRRT